MRGNGPIRIGTDSAPWPLHNAAAAKAFEAHVLAQHAPNTLMERAGLAVARLARALVPHARIVEVWCGPGNNGGDGYVAARRLHQSGTPVRLFECGNPHRLPADAATARQAALAVGLAPLTPAPPAGARPQAAQESQGPPGPADLVVDGLLGLGTSRAPEGALADAIARINASGVPVLAIDLPSGLHPDTGQPLDAAVVQARHTLSLLTLKPGLFTGRGRDFAGTAWFDDLGIDARAPTSTDAAPTAHLVGRITRRALPHATHKGRRGDTWVVGGAPGMAGAASLAARSALTAGAGRVYVSLLSPDARIELDPRRPELMHRPLAEAMPQLADQATAVVGCGGGQAVREVLPSLLARARRLVLDADALNQVALAPELQRLLQGRAARGLLTVLTPHPLEAARLLGIESGAVQADRLAAATALAARTQAVVVLKGSGTVIAAPGTLPRINPSGHAALATAGTGDVLAGWLGGLWAQTRDGDPVEVASAAVWQHGNAADAARPSEVGSGAPLLADDLIAALAASA